MMKLFNMAVMGFAQVAEEHEAPGTKGNPKHIAILIAATTVLALGLAWKDNAFLASKASTGELVSAPGATSDTKTKPLDPHDDPNMSCGLFGCVPKGIRVKSLKEMQAEKAAGAKAAPVAKATSGEAAPSAPDLPGLLADDAWGWVMFDDIGLRIREVKPDSPAAAAGLQVGDKIQWMNGHVIYDTANFKVFLQREPQDPVFKVERGEQSVTIKVKRPAEAKPAEAKPKIGALGLPISDKPARVRSIKEIEADRAKQ
jgi:membrane-associated protease RseP (regulator of RpoE activity)